MGFASLSKATVGVECPGLWTTMLGFFTVTKSRFSVRIRLMGRVLGSSHDGQSRYLQLCRAGGFDKTSRASPD